MTTLIARRHDYLCGRLISLCYALALGRANNLPVRLTWPKGTIYPIHIDPEDVFSSAFLDEYFMDEVTANPIFKAMKVADQKGETVPYRIIEALAENKIPQDMDAGTVPIFKDLLPPDTLNPVLRQVCTTMADETYTAVHIRHGDLVRGNWRHFGHLERFVPYDAAHDFIARRCSPGEYRIHSDEPSAADYLTEAAQAVGDEAFIYVPSQAPEIIDRDIFDVFHMAHAQAIIAPGHSAYSNFAALYLGREKQVMRVSEMVDWAVQEVANPREIIAPDYSVKRHLYIVETLHATRRSDEFISEISRLLDHVEQTWPHNAELYLQLMRFHQRQGAKRDFAQLADRYVEIVSHENDGRLLGPGLVMMRNFRRQFAEDDTMRIGLVDEVISALGG